MRITTRGPAERFGGYLETVRKRHGARADALDAVFAYRARQNEIVRRRSYVTDPEHRFFFALLLNIEGRERIFSLIKQRFADAEPVEKVLDWTFDLANTRVVGVNTPNALGIADFGELDMFLFENMLRGKSEAEMRESIKADYPADAAEKLLAEFDSKAKRLKEAVIFQPLFANSEEQSIAV